MFAVNYLFIVAIEWETVSGNVPLSPDPNNGGQRIFPDKMSPTDGQAGDRRKVKLSATINPAKEGCEVHFAVWDVDDPFDQLYFCPDGPGVTANKPCVPNVEIMDPMYPTGGPDNRGAAGGLTAVSKPTDPNGTASVEFIVSMQPGDNFRAGASTDLNALNAVTQTQADANTPPPKVRFTQMLTVSRFVHVETDSMVRPTFSENTYSADWNTPTPGLGADQVQVLINDPFFEFNTREQQFENGMIKLSGSAGSAIGTIIEYHSTAGWDEIIVSIPASSGINGQQGINGLAGMTTGNATMSDDDLNEPSTFITEQWGCNDTLVVGNALAGPDLSALVERYAPAYIAPQLHPEISGLGNMWIFMRNVNFGLPNFGIEFWNLAYNWRDLPVSKADYWSVLVVAGFQAEEEYDGDPNSEGIPGIISPGLTKGINTHGEGSTQATSLPAHLTGICAVFKAVAIEADVPEKYTVVHEIGHLFGLPHSPAGAMHASDDAEQRKPFTAENLRELRDYEKP